MVYTCPVDQSDIAELQSNLVDGRAATHRTRKSNPLLWTMLGVGAVLVLLAGVLVIEHLSLGPDYLTATHYWDDGKIRVNWKWRRTSAVETTPRGVYSVCIATATIENLGSQPLTINRIVLELVDEHGITLHSENKELNWAPVSAKGAGEATMTFRVQSGLAQDVRSLSARLGFVRPQPQ